MTVPSCRSTQNPRMPGRTISKAIEVTWEAHPQAIAKEDRVSGGRSTDSLSTGQAEPHRATVGRPAESVNGGLAIVSEGFVMDSQRQGKPSWMVV